MPRIAARRRGGGGLLEDAGRLPHEMADVVSNNLTNRSGVLWPDTEPISGHLLQKEPD